MAQFYVDRVIDGDTFNVQNGWSYNGRTGSKVRIADFYAPELHESGGQAAKDLLSRYVLHKHVELKSAQGFSYERLVCDVFVDGKNVAALLRSAS